MPGAYRGPYPTREEAFAALRKPDGRMNRGGSWTAESLGFLASADLRCVLEDLAGVREFRFAGYKGATIILGNSQRTILADRVTGKAYARYTRDPGESLGRATFAEAIEQLNEEIRLDPAEPEPYWERAEVFLGQREWDRAYADYVRALEVAPPDWPLRPEIQSRLASLSH
jgi:tetratricopeptide (TPR) repeat protein